MQSHIHKLPIKLQQLMQFYDFPFNVYACSVSYHDSLSSGSVIWREIIVGDVAAHSLRAEYRNFGNQEN